MTTPALILNSALMLFAASCAFVIGFAQAGTYPDAAQNGVLIGIMSATAQGAGSMFAAMSLGFLALAEDACRNSHALMGEACQLRAAVR